MNIFIDIYWLRVRIFTKSKSLFNMINKYYEVFLVENFSKYDIDINLERFSYFSKKEYFKLNWNYSTFWDWVKIDIKNNKYYFNQQEMSWILDFSDSDFIKVSWKLIPNRFRHLIHIVLQWVTRIDKYYNRFIIKTCIHDIIFILIEKKLKSCLLHATAVTNGEKTFLFTWLWWSGKSTMATSFSKLKWYTILSDNYAIVSGNNIYPFPELPRITKWTQNLLGIKLNKKADGIKNYLDNDVKGLKKEYKIDNIFICSYWKSFNLEKINNKEYLFELLFSINNYTKEFPEYLNLAMLSVINKFNTNKNRISNLEKIISDNNFYLLENDKNLNKNINKILNV